MLKDQLMEEILIALNDDPKKQYPPCKKLLKLSEQTKDAHGIAFACVHLVYCCGLLSKLEERNGHFIRAEQLCQEHNFIQLQIKLYNLMGLSLTDMSDTYLALDYYNKALKLCYSQEIPLEESKIYNNMCVAFADCRDELTALEYAQKAYKTFLPCLNDENKRFLSVYLVNLAMLNISIKNFDKAKEALDECDVLVKDDVDNALYCACQRAALYGKSGEINLCLETEETKIRPQLLSRENGNGFLCDIAGSVLQLMIELDKQKRAKIYLDFIERNLDVLSLSSLYYLIKKIIKYYQKYGDKTRLAEYYEKFYEMIEDITYREDTALALSLCSKVQFAKAKIEQEKLLKENEQLKCDGSTDKLTGLHNLRYFHKIITKFMVEKTTKTLGYIMIDVDCFKAYNDNYGHYIGDEVLKAVAQVLKENAPDNLYICRCGGDEFACLCVNMESNEVENYVRQVQSLLSNKRMQHVTSKVSDIVTLSIGYCNTSDFSDIKKLYKAADSALYEAKRAEKNGYSYMDV